MCCGEQQNQNEKNKKEDLQRCLSPAGEDCSFYLDCMEHVVPCGPRGYASSFALPICEKFLKHSADTALDTSSREWMKHVRKCLQTSVAPWLKSHLQRKLLSHHQNETLCRQLALEAFASHVPCYTADPQNSICRHWWHLTPTVVTTIGWKFLDWDVISNAAAIVKECAPYAWKQITELLL